MKVRLQLLNSIFDSGGYVVWPRVVELPAEDFAPHADDLQYVDNRTTADFGQLEGPVSHVKLELGNYLVIFPIPPVNGGWQRMSMAFLPGKILLPESIFTIEVTRGDVAG